MEFTESSELQLEPTCVEANVGPVYNHRQFQPGAKGGGLSCSSSDQFCFLCSFSSGNDSENDDVSQLNDLIDSLAREKRELPAIVNSVFAIYDQHIKPDVEWLNPHTGMTVSAPFWSKESIHRHLLHSSQYGLLFDSVCESIFQSTIILQQDKMLDLDSGGIVEDQRQSLMDTIKNYSAWRLAQQKLQGTTSGTGKSFK